MYYHYGRACFHTLNEYFEWRHSLSGVHPKWLWNRYRYQSGIKNRDAWRRICKGELRITNNELARKICNLVDSRVPFRCIWKPRKKSKLQNYQTPKQKLRRFYKEHGLRAKDEYLKEVLWLRFNEKNPRTISLDKGKTWIPIYLFTVTGLEDRLNTLVNIIEHTNVDDLLVHDSKGLWWNKKQRQINRRTKSLRERFYEELQKLQEKQ